MSLPQVGEAIRFFHPEGWRFVNYCVIFVFTWFFRLNRSGRYPWALSQKKPIRRMLGFVRIWIAQCGQKRFKCRLF